MSFSSDNLQNAMAEARQATVRRSIRASASQGVPPMGQAEVATPSSPPPPHVTFSIEKKVGDATFPAHGIAGQEEQAKDAVAEAASNYRK